MDLDEIPSRSRKFLGRPGVKASNTHMLSKSNYVERGDSSVGQRGAVRLASEWVGVSVPECDNSRIPSSLRCLAARLLWKLSRCPSLDKYITPPGTKSDGRKINISGGYSVESGVGSSCLPSYRI